MYKPAMAGHEARALLDKVLEEARHLEFDREIFEEVYKSEYRPEFERFCRTGELPLAVIAYCQSQLWREKL